MFSKILILAAGLLGVAVPLTSQGGVVANWDFDTGTALSGTHTATYTANYGANSRDAAFLSGAQMTTITLGANTANQTTGAGYTPTATTALQFTAVHTGNDKSVNGSSFVLSLTSQIALNTFSITYNYLSSITSGTAVNTWTVSGGTGFTTQTANLTMDGGWHSATVSFTGGTLSANQTITFTDALSAYGSANDSYARFDNIRISAVPEPVNVALAVFGFCLVGVGIGRRIYLRARA